MGTRDWSTTKVTIFLYTDDIKAMKKLYGYGWSARIREVLHQWLEKKKKITIQDFLEE